MNNTRFLDDSRRGFLAKFPRQHRSLVARLFYDAAKGVRSPEAVVEAVIAHGRRGAEQADRTGSYSVAELWLFQLVRLQAAPDAARAFAEYAIDSMSLPATARRAIQASRHARTALPEAVTAAGGERR